MALPIGAFVAPPGEGVIQYMVECTVGAALVNEGGAVAGVHIDGCRVGYGGVLLLLNAVPLLLFLVRVLSSV